MNPDARPANVITGWIAAAVLVVALVAIGFGLMHQSGSIGTNTASNDIAPPAATHMTAPAPIPPPSATPAPGTPTPPVTATPNNPPPASPAQPDTAH